MVTNCPVCGKRSVGKVGTIQYYCWECCVEFVVRNDEIKVFDVELDGSLTLYNNFQEQSM
ncbi:hypothetical protein P22_3548 [Propionispora sp. 2/2-37]|nr:hypothetical protein P22_3548 [Propionispora sp. 2/2-37]